MIHIKALRLGNVKEGERHIEVEYEKEDAWCVSLTSRAEPLTLGRDLTIEIQGEPSGAVVISTPGSGLVVHPVASNMIRLKAASD